MEREAEAGLKADRRGHRGSRQADAHAARQTGPDGSLVAWAVRRAQAGDPDALAFLYARYADHVFGHVLGLVRNHHEAEDVTQQVFAKLIGAIGKYREREVPFSAWLMRVARNVAVDHIRGHRPLPMADMAPIREYSRAADPCRLEDLKEALLALPSAQREVIVLRHLAGLSPGEIASHTGRTEGAIHALHHRGRRALASELLAREAAPVTTGMGVAGA